MAITVNHQFVSAKGDGSDATLVRPSNWNASHNINMATNRVIGRLTAGPGLAEELPVTSYMMALLNTADYAALAVLLGLPTTGDAKLTYKSTADVGWILANDGTIGDAGSGATRANLDTQALFTFFYNNFVDAVCPVQTSAGGATTRVAQGTAANAFSTAKCRMVIPKTLGRALIVGGSGAGLTSRTLGTVGGAETHQLTLGEMPSHTHDVTAAGTLNTVDINHQHVQQGTFRAGTDIGDHQHYTTISGTTGSMNRSNPHSHTYNVVNQAQQKSFSAGIAVYYDTVGTNTGSTDINHEHPFSGGAWSGGINAGHQHDTTISGNTGFMTANNTHSHTFTGTLVVSASVGSGNAHNNMQPWTAWNIMIRL